MNEGVRKSASADTQAEVVDEEEVNGWGKGDLPDITALTPIEAARLWQSASLEPKHTFSAESALCCCLPDVQYLAG